MKWVMARTAEVGAMFGGSQACVPAAVAKANGWRVLYDVKSPEEPAQSSIEMTPIGQKKPHELTREVLLNKKRAAVFEEAYLRACEAGKILVHDEGYRVASGGTWAWDVAYIQPGQTDPQRAVFSAKFRDGTAELEWCQLHVFLKVQAYAEGTAAPPSDLMGYTPRESATACPESNDQREVSVDPETLPENNELFDELKAKGYEIDSLNVAARRVVDGRRVSVVKHPGNRFEAAWWDDPEGDASPVESIVANAYSVRDWLVERKLLGSPAIDGFFKELLEDGFVISPKENLAVKDAHGRRVTVLKGLHDTYHLKGFDSPTAAAATWTETGVTLAKARQSLIDRQYLRVRQPYLVDAVRSRDSKSAYIVLEAKGGTELDKLLKETVGNDWSVKSSRTLEDVERDTVYIEQQLEKLLETALSAPIGDRFAAVLRSHGYAITTPLPHAERTIPEAWKAGEPPKPPSPFDMGVFTERARWLPDPEMGPDICYGRRMSKEQVPVRYVYEDGSRIYRKDFRGRGDKPVWGAHWAKQPGQNPVALTGDDDKPYHFDSPEEAAESLFRAGQGPMADSRNPHAPQPADNK